MEWFILRIEWSSAGTQGKGPRFSDFGELRPDSPLAEATQPGGFFPEVSEAAQAADEIRLFGDRAMYLLSRMQVISNFQIDLAYRELVTEPEIRQALEAEEAALGELSRSVGS